MIFAPNFARGCTRYLYINCRKNICPSFHIYHHSWIRHQESVERDLLILSFRKLSLQLPTVVTKGFPRQRILVLRQIYVKYIIVSLLVIQTASAISLHKNGFRTAFCE